MNKNNVKNKDIILAIPSSGLHSNGFSLVRHIQKTKISSFFNNELLKPTKIYVKEILNLNEKKLIHASANITGGGIIGNINRSVPDNLTVNIDLSKIKVKKIFKWIKSKNISDTEMLKTFNCGVGFCLIADKKNIKKIKKAFAVNYKPYEIGYISKTSKRLKLFKSIKW